MKRSNSFRRPCSKLWKSRGAYAITIVGSSPCRVAARNVLISLDLPWSGCGTAAANERLRKSQRPPQARAIRKRSTISAIRRQARSDHGDRPGDRQRSRRKIHSDMRGETKLFMRTSKRRSFSRGRSNDHSLVLMLTPARARKRSGPNQDPPQRNSCEQPNPRSRKVISFETRSRSVRIHK